MRFLVDANLSPRVAARLCDGGCEASHVQDHGLLNADDEKILRHALDTGHVIISADSDFATMLALTGMTSPSLILLRSADHLNPTEQANLYSPIFRQCFTISMLDALSRLAGITCA